MTLRSRPARDLSPRRHQVLALAASGLTDKEIAADLRIRVRTVRFHFAQSCRALGARTRPQATAIAAALGLVNPLTTPTDMPSPGPHNSGGEG